METNSIQKSNKIDWIYFAKGIGIILVVIGHCFRDDMLASSTICKAVYTFIYFFHMCFFFVISGFLAEKSLAEKNNIKSFSIKKVKTILIPFLTYSVIMYTVFFFIYKIPAVSAILSSSSYQLVSIPQYIISALNCSNPYAFHLWFLLILFIFEIASAIIFKIIKSARVRLAIMAIVAFTAYILFSFKIINLYLLDVICNYMLFFVMGQILYYHQKIVSKKSYIIDILSVASLFVAVYYSLNKLKTKSAILYLIFSVLLLLAKVFIIMGIIRFSAKIKNSKLISYLGKQSFVIYLLHQPLNAFIGLILYNKLHLNILLVILICAIVSFALPLLYMVIVRKIKVINKISKKLLNI